jgi:hypothetical protein
MRMMHPRSVALEAHATGEPAPGVTEHLVDCAACRGQIAVLERERTALLERLPVAQFVARVAVRRETAERRARRRRLAVGGVAIAIAAAAVLVVPSMRSSGTRFKGIGVEIFRKRGAAVDALDARARIRAGDGLRVSLTLPEAQRVVLWFVDAHGRIDRYPGVERELPAGPSLLPGVTVDPPCVDMTLIIATRDGRLERALPCE